MYGYHYLWVFLENCLHIDNSAVWFPVKYKAHRRLYARTSYWFFFKQHTDHEEWMILPRRLKCLPLIHRSPRTTIGRFRDISSFSSIFSMLLKSYRNRQPQKALRTASYQILTNFPPDIVIIDVMQHSAAHMVSAMSLLATPQRVANTDDYFPAEPLIYFPATRWPHWLYGFGALRELSWSSGLPRWWTSRCYRRYSPSMLLWYRVAADAALNITTVISPACYARRHHFTEILFPSGSSSLYLFFL